MVQMRIDSGSELRTDFRFAAKRCKEELIGWQGDRLDFTSYQRAEADGGLHVILAELYDTDRDEEPSKSFEVSGLTESECRELEAEVQRCKSMLEYRCEDDPDLHVDELLDEAYRTGQLKRE